MKDLRFAIFGALAIGLGLMVTFGIMFWWKARDSSFGYPAPGLGDFSVHLAGDYSIHRTSALSVIIAPEAWTEATPVIPSLVVECATDGRFVIAKRHGMKRRSPNDPNDTFEVEDPSCEDFWILDTKGPSVEGPLTESEFASRRRSLQIAENVVLRNVYDFEPVAPEAQPPKPQN